jgi:hypothetical protein
MKEKDRGKMFCALRSKVIEKFNYDMQALFRAEEIYKENTLKENTENEDDENE